MIIINWTVDREATLKAVMPHTTDIRTLNRKRDRERERDLEQIK